MSTACASYATAVPVWTTLKNCKAAESWAITSAYLLQNLLCSSNLGRQLCRHVWNGQKSLCLHVVEVHNQQQLQAPLHKQLWLRPRRLLQHIPGLDQLMRAPS